MGIHFTFRIHFANVLRRVIVFVKTKYLTLSRNMDEMPKNIIKLNLIEANCLVQE